MDNLYLIVGLGNPGPEYARTRHNVGFMAVELLGAGLGVRWKMEDRFQARVGRSDVDGRRVWLAEPQTYMNGSGVAVRALSDYYKVPLMNLLVVVDDADLGLGEIRMRPRGSSGGHHGLESIEGQLGTREYPRQRIGIGRRLTEVREITGHVLGRFDAGEAEMVGAVLEKAVRQMKCWLNEGMEKAMNQFNGAIKTPSAKES